MRIITSLSVMLCSLVANSVSAQLLSDMDPAPDVGVSHYERFEQAQYRVLFGMGGNAGLANDAPLSLLGVATYQMGSNVFGGEIARYERPSQYFHFALSGGVGFDSYSERWRRFRPGAMYAQDSIRPNTFEYVVGFPLQIQALYEPFKYAGIGVLMYANFNRISPDFGAALALEARY
jgi:hypothetical protein